MIARSGSIILVFTIGLLIGKCGSRPFSCIFLFLFFSFRALGGLVLRLARKLEVLELVDVMQHLVRNGHTNAVPGL